MAFRGTTAEIPATEAPHVGPPHEADQNMETSRLPKLPAISGRDPVTKPKKYAELQELRQHLTQLGYPNHIINQHMEAHPWYQSFQPTAPNGTNYVPRT